MKDLKNCFLEDGMNQQDLVDQLSFDMGSKLNIDKSEWEKLVEIRDSVERFIKTGNCNISLYRRVMDTNDAYLRLIPLDDNDSDEAYIKKHLQASQNVTLGVVKVFEESLLAYNHITQLLE